MLTIGTSDVTVTVETSVAEWELDGVGVSANNPYIINIREQLDMLADRVNGGKSYEGKFFRLDNYISYGNASGLVYTVIGDATHPFCGTFDGNGKAIQYAGSEVDDGSYQGIFGYIGATGTVKNLQAEDCSFRGHDYIGVIAGYNAGTIQNCRVKYDDNHNGNVTFTADGYSCYGTIAGFNSGTVRECVSSGVVRPTYDLNSYTNVTKAGGIVGHNTGTVANCLYIGSDVIATAYVGAIVGHNNEGTLTNNYYHDNGIQEYSSDPITYGNVAAGTVKGVGVNNGITGDDGDNAKKANVVTFVRASGSYINYQDNIGINAEPTLVTTNNPNSLAYSVYANGILFDDGYVCSHEMDRAFYTTSSSVGLTYTGTVPAGYDIVFNVESGENSLISGTTLIIEDDIVGVSTTQQRVPVADSWLADGIRATSFNTTGTNSITIETPAELGLLAYNVNFGGETYEGYTITLSTGINLTGHTWEPIGYGVGSGGGSYPGGGMVIGGGSSSASGFLGTFDGAGMPILYMNTTCEMNAGLFAILPEGATVKNLSISYATVKGMGYVGAVAGQCNGTITNCHVTNSSVEFTSNEDEGMCLGGISGSCTGGTISGCTVKSTSIYPASVSDARYIGGIVGRIASRMDYVNEIAIPSTLKDNLFAADMFISNGFLFVGTIAGMNQDYSQYGMEGNDITNNYYVNGTAMYATPNTDIKAINGADIVDAAELACAFNELPANIGTAGTQYDYNGVKPYTNGLYHSFIYYAPVSITIPGHGGAAGKWVFIASPVEGSIAFNTVSDLIGSAIPGTDPVVYDFDFYRFNQSAGSEWENYFQHNSDGVNPFNALVNGQGYLYASKEDKELTFTGVFNTASTKTVDLDYDDDATLKGWNLVGNPFPAPAYVNRPFYKMNAQGTGIEAVNDYENAPIDACTGIMVQAETIGESIKFGLSAPVTASNHGNINMTLTQTVTTRGGANVETLDNAIVSFNEGSQLAKFYFGSQNANLYIPQNGEEYAIAFSDKQGEMPLNFEATEDGTYTISVNPEGVEMAYLHLIDNMTGADVDLLALRQAQGPASYTFQAKTTDYESRFRLVFSNCGDAIGDNGTFAFISNGNIIVDGGPSTGSGTLQIVDVMGRVVVQGDAINRVSTSGITPGVYVLRLINGNDVKTQKIVVR